jgi:hypothetical protein
MMCTDRRCIRGTEQSLHFDTEQRAGLGWLLFGPTSSPNESACLGRRPGDSRASQNAAALPLPVPAMKATCSGSQVSRLHDRTCSTRSRDMYRHDLSMRSTHGSSKGVCHPAPGCTVLMKKRRTAPSAERIKQKQCTTAVCNHCPV